jgi:AcrR family transcriptional regulator
MARQPEAGARDRILDVASRLFLEHGVHPVGLQQIIDECGCGKNLLYTHFASKDELIVAYLGRCRREWEAIINRGIQEAGDDPGDQLMAVVRAVGGQVCDPGYRGCPFLNTHAEFRDPGHPAHQVSVGHFEALRRQLAGLAARAGLRDAPGVAERILLIVYGLYSTGAVLGGQDAVPSAIALAGQTIRAAAPAAPAASAPADQPV